MRGEPTLLLLQDVPAVCVPDTTSRCRCVGGPCQFGEPVGVDPGVYKCHRGNEKGDDGFHLGDDVRVLAKGLVRWELVWSYGMVLSTTTDDGILLSMTCSDLIVPHHQSTGSWPPQGLVMSGCICSQVWRAWAAHPLYETGMS